MDRDGNWDRTQAAYRVLTTPQQTSFFSWQQVLDFYYKQHITDEFIPPTQLYANSIIQDGDGIIFFNFRADRARQLTAAFTQPSFTAFPTLPFHLAFFLTMADYILTSSRAVPLFAKQFVNNTLNYCITRNGKKIFYIAETEKYAHITYFFDGGQEQQFPTETRVLIPSIRTQDYVQHTDMSAHKITDRALESLTQDPRDFYLINYANPDMVGHSGDFQATVKAIECIDQQLGSLYDAFVIKNNGMLFITGDHGKAEEMMDESGQPKTSHTTNQVPFIMIANNLKHTSLPAGITQLRDIAPLILQTFQIPIPAEMQPSNAFDSVRNKT
jgi:2,3-bisphosphoglycerate-independent phosphoglycerate mutase